MFEFETLKYLKKFNKSKKIFQISTNPKIHERLDFHVKNREKIWLIGLIELG